MKNIQTYFLHSTFSFVRKGFIKNNKNVINGIRQSFLIRNNIPNLTQHRKKARSHPSSKVWCARRNDTCKHFKNA